MSWLTEQAIQLMISTLSTRQSEAPSFWVAGGAWPLLRPRPHPHSTPSPSPPLCLFLPRSTTTPTNSSPVRPLPWVHPALVLSLPQCLLHAAERLITGTGREGEAADWWGLPAGRSCCGRSWSWEAAPTIFFPWVLQPWSTHRVSAYAGSYQDELHSWAAMHNSGWKVEVTSLICLEKILLLEFANSHSNLLSVYFSEHNLYVSLSEITTWWRCSVGSSWMGDV